MALVIHLLLDLQEAPEVQAILVAQFLGVQLDQCGLFHQEVLVTPFHQGSPIPHHPEGLGDLVNLVFHPCLARLAHQGAPAAQDHPDRLATLILY